VCAPHRSLVVGDLRRLAADLVAVEVHLPVAVRPQQQRLAVLADVVQRHLLVHLDDRRRLAVPADPVDVVLLVAGLVEVEEHAVAVGGPLDAPPGVPGHLAVAPGLVLAALDVEDVQLVATGHVVVERDLRAVGRHRRVCQRRQARQFFEYVLLVRPRHTSETAGGHFSLS
jgi:hypothetical protein